VTSSFVTLFAGLSFFAASFASGTLDFNFASAAWLPVAGLAFLSTVVSVLTFFRGLELIGSTRASILSIIEPLVTVVFSALLFSERLTALQILGGFGVLGGAGLVVWAAKDSS
jgi:drug/metabolite transporter (DMT)-like permease